MQSSKACCGSASFWHTGGNVATFLCAPAVIRRPAKAGKSGVHGGTGQWEGLEEVESSPGREERGGDGVGGLDPGGGGIGGHSAYLILCPFPSSTCMD